ncbi:MAG: C40 family peptidase [Muribaculaceae bacterium]|nr:C40 family peptidase [Muribaculaceae bacterium]
MNFKSLFIAIVLAVTSFAAMAITPVEALNDLKQRIAPDKRTAVWDVNASKQNGRWVLSGTVGTQAQKKAIQAAMIKNGFSGYTDKITVLEDGIPAARKWAQIKLSIATLRTEPKHSAEMATQGIMGAPVKVLQKDGDWYRVQMADDYIAYVPESSLAFKTETQMKAWRKAKRYIVTAYDSRMVTEPHGDETVSDLVMGNILELKAEQGRWLKLVTPDGRVGWVDAADMAELSQWSQQGFSAAQIEKTARRMMGSSYLWGGTSTKVTDCSGLTKVAYLSNGIILQRDASQQALTGKIMKKGTDWHQYQSGDLLFFGNEKTGRVTHVGLYLRDGKYIHCSGQVKINSLDPRASDYPYLYSPLSASRINGMVGTKGIVALKNHPWYF